MTDQAPELLPCRAKRDDLGYRCGECGASWIGRQNPPDCLRNQIARTILKKFLGVDDFKKTTEGWDAGCIELAGEILALTRPPSERPVAAVAREGSTVLYPRGAEFIVQRRVVSENGPIMLYLKGHNAAFWAGENQVRAIPHEEAGRETMTSVPGDDGGL